MPSLLFVRKKVCRMLKFALKNMAVHRARVLLVALSLSLIHI